MLRDTAGARVRGDIVACVIYIKQVTRGKLIQGSERASTTIRESDSVICGRPSLAAGEAGTGFHHGRQGHRSKEICGQTGRSRTKPFASAEQQGQKPRQTAAESQDTPQSRYLGARRGLERWADHGGPRHQHVYGYTRAPAIRGRRS